VNKEPGGKRTGKEKGTEGEIGGGGGQNWSRNERVREGIRHLSSVEDWCVCVCARVVCVWKWKSVMETKYKCVLFSYCYNDVENEGCCSNTVKRIIPKRKFIICPPTALINHKIFLKIRFVTWMEVSKGFSWICYSKNMFSESLYCLIIVYT